MPLSDTMIRALCVPCEQNLFNLTAPPLIENFSEAVDEPDKVSHGLTSAGYDVRISGVQVKVFNPSYGETINPKKMKDPDYQDRVFIKRTFLVGEVISIPANSYVLGVTVERFNVPRWLKGVCVGKSTYARCFTGGTKVTLLDGTEPTFAEMAADPDTRRWGFGVDPSNGYYEVTELTAPRWVGCENVVRVTLDDGSHIECTPDHEFLRHSGYYTPAEALRPGDGLVPMYRKRFRGRAGVWCPPARIWMGAAWMADLWNVKHGVYEPSPGTHRHHQDKDKTNDNPTNIVRKEASQHIRDHNAEYYGDGFNSEGHGLKISKALARRMADPEWAEAYRQMQSDKAKKFWGSAEFEAARADRNEKLRQSWQGADDRKAAAAVRMREVTEKNKASGHYERVWTEERRQRQAEVMRKVNKSIGKGNHTVVSVESVRGKQDVFCVTSGDTGNFALSSGVIAKNCGIIVNVTPLEPDWSGYLTIEISNSAPMQAEIYAGEGIAQLEFHKIDGPVQKSYKDKRPGGGRYQNQDGVTVARVG
jgi:deoxycytidine triphosphate deaminase